MGKGKPSILVAHGVNLDLLGVREPDIYGRMTLKDLKKQVEKLAPDLAAAAGFGGIKLHWFQTNDETAFLAELDKGWDGAVLNPGAWTHTSLALADRLAGLGLPFVEVHLSNLARRETRRHITLCGPHALGSVDGLGAASYSAGLLGLLLKLAAKP